MRFRPVILLASLGLASFVLLRPEIQQRLESGFLPETGAADASLQETESAPAIDQSNAFLLPGSHLAFELMSAPQSHYLGKLDEDAGDMDFRERVHSVTGKEAHYDPWLSRAAREVAYQGALLSDSPPEAALAFILRSAGAPELSVAQVLVRAHGDDPMVIDDAIAGAFASAPSGAGQLLIGVGEAATEGGTYDRRVVVLVARRNFSLHSTARSVDRNGTWHIRGTAPAAFRDAQASVLYPSNEVAELPLDIDDGEFSLAVPTGSQAGSLRVSIDGVGAAGPFKLLQLMAEVAAPPPTYFEVLVSETESFEELADAEGHALQLLNEDRRILGLPPLSLDLALSDVARGHSDEMRDKKFFAHMSPSTGLAGDRLQSAGYRASAHGENLALNDSIFEAQSSLMESVGHRRNIISESMTHVGIGLARGEEKGARASWYLTQVFARKVLAFDADEAGEQFLRRINAAREEAGADSLAWDEDLSALAAHACSLALSMPVDDLPSAIAPHASEIARAGVAVSVHVFYDFESLVPDATSLGNRFTRAGLAFLRDEEHAHGRTFLVLIAAE